MRRVIAGLLLLSSVLGIGCLGKSAEAAYHPDASFFKKMEELLANAPSHYLQAGNTYQEGDVAWFVGSSYAWEMQLQEWRLIREGEYAGNFKVNFWKCLPDRIKSWSMVLFEGQLIYDPVDEVINYDPMHSSEAIAKSEKIQKLLAGLFLQSKTGSNDGALSLVADGATPEQLFAEDLLRHRLPFVSYQQYGTRSVSGRIYPLYVATYGKSLCIEDETLTTELLKRYGPFSIHGIIIQKNDVGEWRVSVFRRPNQDDEGFKKFWQNLAEGKFSFSVFRITKGDLPHPMNHLADSMLDAIEFIAVYGEDSRYHCERAMQIFFRGELSKEVSAALPGILRDAETE
ncbi:MAG: hypothetical protein Q7R73_01060 [bacterium]|nr:hypothetical protein [bacterium]